jgi:hypothetical protein
MTLDTSLASTFIGQAMLIDVKKVIVRFLGKDVLVIDSHLVPLVSGNETYFYLYGPRYGKTCNRRILTAACSLYCRLPLN